MMCGSQRSPLSKVNFRTHFQLLYLGCQPRRTLLIYIVHLGRITKWLLQQVEYRTGGNLSRVKTFANLVLLVRRPSLRIVHLRCTPINFKRKAVVHGRTWLGDIYRTRKQVLAAATGKWQNRILFFLFLIWTKGLR